MSTSPDPIVRGSRASAATAARFEVDFRRTTDVPVPADLVERARASAIAAGYAEGWAQGQREAKAAAQAAEARARAAEQELAQARAAALDRAIGAVLAAADQVAQQSVPVAERGLDALRRVMATAPATGTLIVRLHPEDIDALGAPDGNYVLNGRAVTLRPDTSLAPGDAIAEQGTSTIDARLAEAVRRVRAELAR